MVAIGRVISVNDPNDGDRIKVKIFSADGRKSDNDIMYAFPLLPRIIHVKPKVGEAVFVLFDDDKNQNSQRYYIGPIISDLSQFEKSLYGGGTTKLLNGGVGEEITPIVNNNKGAFPKDDDIAIVGRKDCDIILSDEDIRIRCGVHQLQDGTVSFNTNNPAFIKLKYYPNKLSHTKQENTYSSTDMTTTTIETENENIGSVATVVADKINLIGNGGDPYFSIDDKDESISDQTIINILDKAHQLPYGDKLCEFLADLLTVFKNHTHNYNNMTPVNDPILVRFNQKYGDTSSQIGRILLSDSVRIN